MGEAINNAPHLPSETATRFTRFNKMGRFFGGGCDKTGEAREFSLPFNLALGERPRARGVGTRAVSFSEGRQRESCLRPPLWKPPL